MLDTSLAGNSIRGSAGGGASNANWRPTCYHCFPPVYLPVYCMVRLVAKLIFLHCSKLSATQPILLFRSSERVRKFDAMQAQINIEFDQLLKIVRTLPARQLRKLKVEIDKEANDKRTKIDLERLLLDGPTATKKQLMIIENNRKALNQWRTR